MLDIKYIRENKDLVATNTRNKGYDVSIDELLQQDDRRRNLVTKIDELRTKRNDLSNAINGQKPSEEVIEQVRSIKDKLAKYEQDLGECEKSYSGLLKSVPNIALGDVPLGASENENVVIKTVNEPKKDIENAKNHAEIATARGWIDKERAAKVAGSRFAYVKGDLVMLQFAIIRFVLDIVTSRDKIREILNSAGLGELSDKPFVPVLPPYFIRTDLYDAMDRLEPRDERYKLEDEDAWLQGSAEHVLGSMHAEEIISELEMPIRYIGYATSFRREAGTYGKDMEGLFRMHQFDKLEFETLSTKETGLNEHKLLVALQEHLLSKLELPYRVLQKCTADIGKPNAQGIDMEVWLPGQDKYRETHTADYMTDYQSRRLLTRVRRGDGLVELVHTNDATAFALGRIMIAIIENNQNKDQTITIPEVLRPYLDNKSVL